MRYPKIVVIGAGSASFGLTNLGAIMRTKELAGATLCLCDINAEGLEQITLLARRINDEWGCQMKIEASTDRTVLLPDADFVVVSVAIDREKCWEMDHELTKKYGIIHYAENGGPGGFFHAARNIALLMPVFKDIERLAPNALVLNFTNPMTRICTAAARYTSINMVGICHQIDFGYMMCARILGKTLGLDVNHNYLFDWGHNPDEHKLADAGRDRFDVLAAGVNHFTWFLSIKDKKTGEELLPLFKKLFMEQTDFEPYTRDMISVFDQCPTSGDAHFLEYVPYSASIQHKSWERYDIKMYPLHKGDKQRDEMWSKITRMATGEESIDSLKHVRTERAEQIITAVWTGNHTYDYAVNIKNTAGCIANLPTDAIVEVPAIIGLHGIKGIAVGELPQVVQSFCSKQKDIVDIAVRAMVEGDKQAALQALALDPMVHDLDLARAILNEGLAQQNEYLPQFFK